MLWESETSSVLCDMEEELVDVLYAERKFEVYDIKWVIEDFSLVTCGKNWLIQSPEFTVRGVHTTKWSITLKPAWNMNADFMVFTLTRCDTDSAPQRMLIEWRLNISVAGKKDFIIMDRFCGFGKGTEYKENFKCLKPSVDVFDKFESDLMTIQGKMVVYEKVVNDEFEPCPDKGKMCLSDNLLNMFLCSRDCDLELKIDHKTILAHKAITCTRIERLNRLLEQAELTTDSATCRKIEVIDLSFINYDAMMKIMEYIYSGDLKHVLAEPSLAICDCIHKLDIWHLKKFYVAKKLTFRTSLDAQEIRFTWVIKHFSQNNEDLIVSPEFIDDNFSTSWQLRLFPGKEKDRDYFSFFSENVGEYKPSNMRFEFAITNETGETLFAKSLRSATNAKKTYGFGKFIRRSILKTYLNNDILRLTMKLKMSSNTMRSCVENHDISVLTNFQEINSFDLLSLNMKNLLENSDFSDVSLRRKDESFEIHKSIVASRCRSLDALLSNVKEEQFEPAVFADTEPHIICMLLHYLYIGVLPETEDGEELTELRKVARTVNLPLLEDLCSEALQT